MTEHGGQVGFGAKNYNLAIYLANRPPLDDYPSRDHLTPLLPAELAHIVANTSNHWRKVFNVYAKFLFALEEPRVTAAGSWQAYRDQSLLQGHSAEALLFSPPDFTVKQTVHIVAGKTYAAELHNQGRIAELDWLDTHFAVNRSQRLVVCPYLDYRQLSNERIGRLVDIVRGLRAPRLASSATSRPAAKPEQPHAQ
ncbi:DUF6942 family protein [Pseudomaricurvus hydrocarbonicus]|uniref:DUF6942 family protein n=1 Tax=Pseudomaricurvus hydrocarbonicus TaxID=1470433 RepID=UPI001AA07108|nr:hypothetical protein [Aestuariicella hydrocarbonica]